MNEQDFAEILWLIAEGERYKKWFLESIKQREALEEEIRELKLEIRSREKTDDNP